MKKFVDYQKMSKKAQKAENARSRNGSWSGYRPAIMRDKTKYTRKGRRAIDY